LATLEPKLRFVLFPLENVGEKSVAAGHEKALAKE
jgi:hypothetical protein